MRSLILDTCTRLLMPLLMLFSVFVLLRGHNEPGGGFIGGLVVSVAFTLLAFSIGVRETRRTLHVEPRLLLATGLSLALGSALLSPLAGRPMMTDIWLPVAVPVLGHIGTPLIFDTGVYLVVLGVMMTIIFSLAEE